MLEESTGNFSATRNIYDWYQNSSYVILNVMIKNLKESDVKVKLIDETLDVSCNLADGSEFKLHFNLFKAIYVNESSWTVSPSKLEIKLKKTDRKRWQSLEVLPDKSGKRPLSFVGFVQQSAAKKANMEINKVNNDFLFKPKYDWHQTSTHVNIAVHISNLNPSDVRVEFTENGLYWYCKLPDGSDYEENLRLFRSVVVDQSTWQLTVSKIDISLRKRDHCRWSALTVAPVKIPSNSEVMTTYISEASPEPSCSGVDNSNDNDNSEHESVNNSVNIGGNIISIDSNQVIAIQGKNDLNYTLVTLQTTNVNNDSNSNDVNDDIISEVKNEVKDLESLDKIVSEFKEKEKLIEEKGKITANDENVDELLREIYEKGGEEVRRAMNKRFNESGVSVLNIEELKNENEDKTVIELKAAESEVCEILTPNNS